MIAPTSTSHDDRKRKATIGGGMYIVSAGRGGRDAWPATQSEYTRTRGGGGAKRPDAPARQLKESLARPAHAARETIAHAAPRYILYIWLYMVVVYIEGARARGN